MVTGTRITITINRIIRLRCQALQLGSATRTSLEPSVSEDLQLPGLRRLFRAANLNPGPERSFVVPVYSGAPPDRQRHLYEEIDTTARFEAKGFCMSYHV